MVLNEKILLCCDLDRTVLPNGIAPESSDALPLLHRLVNRDEVILAYVSGRNKLLLQEAIAQYHIPVPQYAIGDVGTTIYRIENDQWCLNTPWIEQIGHDWRDRSRSELMTLLTDFHQIRLQETDSQGKYKLSYFVHPHIDYQLLCQQIEARFAEYEIQVSLIWSIDEVLDIGLLDILPSCATKLHAVRYLMDMTDSREERTVYAGDSGNDLPVLTSGLQSILVANAHPDIRTEAQQKLSLMGVAHKLYLARGGLYGMNGNYSAGIIEGVVHFIPEARQWLEDD